MENTKQDIEGCADLHKLISKIPNKFFKVHDFDEEEDLVVQFTDKQLAALLEFVQQKEDLLSCPRIESYSMKYGKKHNLGFMENVNYIVKTTKENEGQGR